MQNGRFFLGGGVVGGGSYFLLKMLNVYLRSVCPKFLEGSLVVVKTK